MAGETEKLTLNVGPMDLGQIELLVREGFYANRADFLRTAIRGQLAQHADAVRQTVARRSLVLGLQHYGRAELEALRDAGQMVHIQALGLVTIGDEVPPELAAQTIASVSVLGAFRASEGVRAALAGRIT